MGDPERARSLERRYARERKARLEAEAIAERVTSELYATVGQLENVNAVLEKTNEDLAAANESIREFVAIASHDIRGPLAVILGLSEMLHDQADDLSKEQSAQMVRSIRDRGKMLQRLVEDLLTVSKIEAGAIVTHVEEFALVEAVRSVIDGLGDEATNVQLCTPDDLVVRADPDHVQRIFSNYLANALTYGAPPVGIKATEAGPFVEAAVEDQGPGVPAELAPRLFGKFARSEDSKSRDGTGLGLSIVRGLAQANGGDAWYRPVRPHGSCFMVKLPRAEKKSAL